MGEFLGHLCSLPEYAGQITHLERISARGAEYGDLSRPLPPPLREALRRRGVERLYAHQAEAINALRAGQHVIVATGTSSGKTLCYNLPVLEAIVGEPVSRALYLFPTKALAQDQLRSLRELTDALEGVRAATYDGDTPNHSRARVRKRAAIVLSNPDMLSVGILPHHPSWASFFRHLKYVVLDEAHAYRGIFGSHVACVVRRLRRVCALHGSRPQFVLCSATIANAAEHAERLVGCKVTVVERDGSPHGPRQFLLWNPPYLDEATGVRRSPNTDATWIFSEMIRRGVRNITFTRTRIDSELILVYARRALRQEEPELVDRISAYRGGYLSGERREIERRLFSGELLGVAATNALELGIDVGQLDATLSVGYPGSIASTWQQAGRAGRGEREALSILIARGDPLDQFFIRHPEELFGRSHENALIDPGNPFVLQAHLACAALESPLAEGDEPLFGEGYASALLALERSGRLVRRNRRWYLASEDYPAGSVNLRATFESVYTLVDETNGDAPLEEVDAETAFRRIHPGAIYLHRAEPYLVTRLDLRSRVAYARPIRPGYYTQPLEVSDVHIIRSLQARSLASADVFFGNVRVTRQVNGFLRKQQATDAILSSEPLELPPYSFETQALWFEPPEPSQREIQSRGLDFHGGLHAVEHACIGILPLFAMCDRNDIGGLSTPEHPDTGRPQVFVYDGYPGGVGIARKGYQIIEEWWRSTLETVRGCPCESGCPSCIQSPKCGDHNEPLDKQAAILLLERLVRK